MMQPQELFRNTVPEFNLQLHSKASTRGGKDHGLSSANAWLMSCPHITVATQPALTSAAADFVTNR